MPPSPYVCLSPYSLWYTKQMVVWRWIDLCENLIKLGYNVAILGGNEDVKKIIYFLKNSKLMIIYMIL